MSARCGIVQHPCNKSPSAIAVTIVLAAIAGVRTKVFRCTRFRYSGATLVTAYRHRYSGAAIRGGLLHR